MNKSVIGIMLIFLCSTLFPWNVGNSTEIFFLPLTGPDSERAVSLESLIIDGATHFLKTGAEINSMLLYIEIAKELDYNKLSEIAEGCRKNIKKAVADYENLCDKAESTPYNNILIKKLYKFNYNSYKEKHNLVDSSFNDVKELMSQGDIRGVYNRFLQNSQNILSSVKMVISSIEKNDFAIEKLWNLNNEYTKALLFGQYTAQIAIANR